MRTDYDILIIGGGHAGAEAAWAAANLTAPTGGRVALITMDPSKTGAMSCNPAIGGLAKGQMVREIDALGGLMGLAADATGIQFRVLNISKGPAVQGPRCQNDKYAYAAEVQRLLGTRENLDILPGLVEDFVVEDGRCVGVVFRGGHGQGHPEETQDCCGEFCAIDAVDKTITLRAGAVVLTTGTFMRALMHAGEQKTEGGRIGEGSAVGISGALTKLGLDLGRLKTGTPPRLAAESIDFSGLEVQPGDEHPTPFSEMTWSGDGSVSEGKPADAKLRRGSDAPNDTSLAAVPQPRAFEGAYDKVANRFPVAEQRVCWITHTNAESHDLIRNNLDRAPMYNGQIETAGPRYCPSIEDKVVRFADRTSHHVFLEPESLSTNEIYCNGISTSLPIDVQKKIVHALPGCENAVILKPGYAVEYDMVWPHQIDATCMTKRVPGLFLAGQINGTSGYEEAAGQGLIAGVNAVRYMRGQDPWRLRRDEAYLGVMMDDLVTKTPREPYRMFTSRAEHRLLLRSDNADARLTPVGRDLGTVDDARWSVFEAKQQRIAELNKWIDSTQIDGKPMSKWVNSAGVGLEQVWTELRKPADAQLRRGSDAQGDASCAAAPQPRAFDDGGDLEALREARALRAVLANRQYAGYIDRSRREIERLSESESIPVPTDFDFNAVPGLRNEAAAVLDKFRPTTLGQAGRLAGVNPADVMIVSVALGR
ncbi:tRNA uridine-5-carboxymethylaminomethyl modification enzyme MnmG/GidA [Algisphaera agarilytica]|uniref:tRNA uridine 5-carboxymethylaminomethyl modification enzyme MnmG n=1 Tax=Algisphaera agarilytica TaxID=1385975 RepID=A0A7X0HAU4_9BACT|nr:FAD-dependent oxidoreductase [Algisphaera agarilytica]MBB6430990.1 tRNA uridine 5-carboxymethylaminomethyl modification enzyme [Algisphaera agarilytica]